MKKTFLLFFFICLVTALPSCRKNDVGDELDEIFIRCYTKLTSGNLTTLVFNFSGGKFECDNVALRYEIHRSDDAIFLTIGKSYIPDSIPCYGNSHNTYSAKGTFTLEDIENGDYVLVISALDNILYAGLQIDEKKVSIVNGKGSIISFGSDYYVEYKIPRDAVWGYASNYPDSLARLFQDSLIALGAVPYAPLLESGNYGSFSLSNGSVSYWGYDGDDEFLLKTNMDTTAIRDVMKYFCNNEIIDWIHVFTGKGDDLMQY